MYRPGGRVRVPAMLGPVLVGTGAPVMVVPGSVMVLTTVTEAVVPAPVLTLMLVTVETTGGDTSRRT